MMIEAVERGIIAADPTAKVERLINDRDEIRIITPLEFKKLFVEDWHKVWEDNFIACTVNKVAALSGMRVSEILGLKGSCLYDDHIYVFMQHDNYGYRPTKTKDKHNIPLPASLIEEMLSAPCATADITALNVAGRQLTAGFLRVGLQTACSRQYPKALRQPWTMQKSTARPY